MLVLSRKKDEQLQIGENIVVTILKVKGNSVQIGIEAPHEVKVLRGELTANASSPLETKSRKPTNRRDGTASRTASPLRRFATQAVRENATHQALQLV